MPPAVSAERRVSANAAFASEWTATGSRAELEFRPYWLRQKEMYRVENGEIMAAELPGIGLDVNVDALREFRREG